MNPRAACLITKIEKHVRDALETAKSSDLNDSTSFKAISMDCFQAINLAIDLGEHLITEKTLPTPGKYWEIFEVIHKEKIINVKLKNELQRLTTLRNIVAHAYYDFEKKELTEMTEKLAYILEFTKIAKKTLA